jgi:SOS-response transcriptional repressor LexA
MGDLSPFLGNSQGFFPDCEWGCKRHYIAMQKTLIQKIDKRLDELNMSRTAASVRAGFGPEFIRDIVRKGKSPSTDNLKKLAGALQVDVDYFFDDEGSSVERRDTIELPVIGTIEAGQFRDITLLDQDEVYPVISVVADKRFSHAKQYALQVSGDSMNLKYPDGSYVTCVDYIGSGLRLKSGMTLHVERTIAGTHLVEITLKEVQSIDGNLVLIPRSSNPKHKPIIVNGGEDTEIHIRGIVTGSWIPERF